ncbi:ATP-binding protein [Bdellovibrio bacteriovorus]|nr:ATP-binding protein [Bdellovibrio bacteriovorus]
MLSNKISNRLHLIFAFITLALGLTVMTGWWTKNLTIVQIHADFAPMVFNTAFCFTVFSLGLLFSDRKNQTFSKVCSAIVLVVSGLTIVQYLTGVNLGIDKLFVDPFVSVGSVISGRMAISTAICFIMISLSRFFKKRDFSSHIIVVTVSSLVIGFSLIGIFGYAFGFNSEYGWGSFSRMAVHTSIGQVLLALAMLWQLRVENRLLPEARRRTSVPSYVLIVGILTSILIWHLLILRDQDRNRRVVQIQAESIKANITNIFAPLEKALQHMARRFAAGAYENEKMWYADAESYFTEFEGLRRLLWADQNHIVQWVYPLDRGGSKLIKANVSTDAAVKERMAIAESEHRAYLSKFMELKTGGKGFVMFAPIYNKDKYLGTIRGAFLAKPVFEKIIDLSGYHLTIYEDGHEVYSSGTADAVFARDWKTKSRYHYMGAEWEILLIPSPEIIRENTSSLPNLVLFFGVSISVLLGIALSFFTRARDSEKAAKEAFEWKQAGMNSVPLLMISLDENTVIREMNSAAERILEYSTDEIKGKETPAIFHDLNEVIAFRDKMALQVGKSIELGPEYFEYFFKLGYNRASEWTIISKTGRRYSMVLSLSKILDEQGKVTGYLGILEDVTQLREKEKLLKEQEQKILASSRLASLGEMAAGIAHEINNPLAIINGHVSVLRRVLSQKGVQDGDVTKKLDAIESVIQRIAKIIRGMRSYAHETDLTSEEVIAVDTLVDETLAFCHEKFKSEGVELAAQIQPDLKLRGRPYQISQVLLNLLNNAMDAVAVSPVKKVSLDASLRNGGIEISVSDTGPGVPYHLRSKIMEPFFTTKEVGKGVGLGLSISQGIVQAHGGKFYLDDNSTKTRFVIWLPQEKA